MFLKKIIYVAAILFYAGIGIIGAVGNGYTELGGTEKIFKNNLLLVLIIGLSIGILVLYNFAKLFPKAHAKHDRYSKIVLSIFILTLALGITMGNFLFINSSLGNIKPITINGFIEKKWSRAGRKKSDYYLGLKDSASGKYYEFEVKKNIYYQVGEKGDKISKVFYKGSLGVIYRYSY